MWSRPSALALCFFGLFALTGSAAAGVGQFLSPNAALPANVVVLQTGVAVGSSYTVPPGVWTVTNWSITTGTGPTVGPVAVVVAKPTTGGQFKIEGVGAPETPALGMINAYPTSLTVHGGDILGLWHGSGNFANVALTGSSADTVAVQSGVTATPGKGTNLATTLGSDLRLPLTLTLTPVGADTQVNHVFVCYSKWEHDGGEVVDADTAQLLLELGRWLPMALQGSVPGGDNIGDYHLACNPPAEAQPTNFYVGDGGDVLDWDSQFYYRIYN
jgi:hypothetical protein